MRNEVCFMLIFAALVLCQGKSPLKKLGEERPMGALQDELGRYRPPKSNPFSSYPNSTWEGRMFLRYWRKHKEDSCVGVCGMENKDVEFQFPTSTGCNNTVCTYYLRNPFEDIVKMFARTKKGTCNNGVARCSRISDACYYYSWMSKTISAKSSGSIMNRDILDLVPRYPEAFRALTILESPLPGTVVVVGFYFPDFTFADGCNKLYCVYSDTSTSNFEVYVATPGDVTFTFCRKPTKITPHTTLRLVYHPELISPSSPFRVEPAQDNMPHVKMSICVIVKKEGKNLVEWIEYHRIIGFERFILYDNNPTGEKDEEMAHIADLYKETVKIISWETPYSQTEAYTDCISRFRHTTKWISFIDIDEFIVPHPKYATLLELLDEEHPRDDYIHFYWLTFGPCDEPHVDTYPLLMESCHNVTVSSSESPKAIIRASKAGGMKGFGPHHVRMLKNINSQLGSRAVVSTSIKNYHYRFKFYRDFMERRLGKRADRALELTESYLKYEWELGMKKSKPLEKEKNWILRFRDELKERMDIISQRRNPTIHDEHNL